MDRGAWKATVQGVAESNTTEPLTLSLLLHELLPSPQQAQPSLTSGSHPALHSFSTPPPPHPPAAPPPPPHALALPLAPGEWIPLR